MSQESIQAMNNLAEAINNYTTEIKKQDLDRMMSAEDIRIEYGIGENQIYKIFNNPNVAVQKFTRPAKIKRSELIKFFETRHDEL